MESHSGPGTPTDPESMLPPAPGTRDRYDRAIDLSTDNTHSRVIRLVGKDRHVLELGPATGHMTRMLRDRGCTVVGIEVDTDMAEQAARYCERVIIGDLDQLDLDAELGSEHFDVIIAADVLEHLKDPLSALRRLRRFLSSDGHVVISVPNIAHGSVRIALLQGHFDYQPVGLLDTTHLRFFTRESIGDLLDEAELAVAEIYHQQLNIDAAEVPFDPAGVPAEVLENLHRDPMASTYQFVIKAVPLDTPGLRDIQRRLRELAHENATLRELSAQSDHVTEQESQRLREQLTQLRGALINAHDQVLRRDEEIHRLQEELEAVRAQGQLAAQEATQLRVRLERITNSPPGRAYRTLTMLPLLRGVKASRTAAYERAVRAAGRRGSPS